MLLLGLSLPSFLSTNAQASSSFVKCEPPDGGIHIAVGQTSPPIDCVFSNNSQYAIAIRLDMFVGNDECGPSPIVAGYNAEGFHCDVSGGVPIQANAGSSTPFQVTISTNAGKPDTAVPGSYNLRLDEQWCDLEYCGDGQLSTSEQNIPFEVTSGDFSIACNPISDPVNPGNTAQTTCTISSVSGFSSPVDLTCDAPPESKITCGFSPTPVTPDPNQSTKTNLVISTDANSPGGTYKLHIKGTSDGIIHDTILPVNVVAVILHPSNGPPDTHVVVSGCCFSTGGITVKVSFDNVVVGEGSTSNDGAFATIPITVPASTAAVHSISVTDSSAAGEGSSSPPSADFTVIAGATTVSQDEINKLKVQEGSAANDPQVCTPQRPTNCHFAPGHTGDYGLYQDPLGYCTLGYGHLMHRSACVVGDVNAADALMGTNKHPYTEQQASDLLTNTDVPIHTKNVLNTLGKIQLSQGQLDALTDFDFMETGGVGAANSLLDTINTGHSDHCNRVTYDFLLFDQGSPGLQARHQNQADTFNGGTIYCYPTTPYP